MPGPNMLTSFTVGWGGLVWSFESFVSVLAGGSFTDFIVFKQSFRLSRAPSLNKLTVVLLLSVLIASARP